MIAGCETEQAKRQSSKKSGTAHPSGTTYSAESITFDYPDWADVDEKDEGQFMLKSDGKCVFAAAKYPVPVSMMKKGMEKDLDAVFDGDYASYEMSGFNAKTRLIYCDYDTYLISIMCKGTLDTSMLSSAKCEQRELNTKPKLGLIPLPANDDSSLILPAIREARENGAEVLSWYLFWADLEDDWSVADRLMTVLAYEGKTAALMNVIYINQLGEFPAEFKHFKDDGFEEAFADFSNEFIERYSPDYYFIGGEVDIYLNQHRDEIDDYKEFFRYVKKEINKASPETKIGMVFAYHAAKHSDALDIIETLGPECDVIGYTVHAYEDDFDYSDVSHGLQYLEEAGELVPDVPYAIIETGWSSSELLGSSEDKQVEFAEDFFDYLETTDAEFVIWFGLHEWSDCTEAAETFIKGIKVDAEYLERFKEFMCSTGLKRADGTPKKAWDMWQEYVKT